MITRELIVGLAPRPSVKSKSVIWDAYVDALVSGETAGRLRLAGIVTEARLAHLLAQWLHESGGFTVLWEDMRYSAVRIMQIFGEGRHSAKVTLDQAKMLARDDAGLAERVYGLGSPRKAKELGNRDVGDGYRYRGFGIGQITGRADHERLLAGQQTAQASINAAIQEWTEKKCNSLADADGMEAITRKINGGTNGLDDRAEWLEKTKVACQGVVFTSPRPMRAPSIETPPLPNGIDSSPAPHAPSAPAPSLVAVAAKSKTVWSLLNAKLLIVFGFLTDIGRDGFDWIAGLVGAVPNALNEATGLAEQGGKLSELVGFDWKRIAISATVACLAVALVRHLRDKRELEVLRRQPEIVAGPQP